MKKQMKIAIGVIGFLSLALLSPSSFADAANIGDIGNTLASQATGVSKAIYYGALVAGIGLVALSLFMGYAASKPQSQTTWKPVIMAFVFGSALLSITAITSVGSGTLGTSQDSRAATFLSQ